MSGSGGGSYTPGGGGSDIDCNIVRREALTDPDPVALKKVARGTVCLVQLDERDGRKRLNVINPENGEVIGILFYSGYTRLVECIRKGHDYVAVVESVRAGWCEVELRNAL